MLLDTTAKQSITSEEELTQQMKEGLNEMKELELFFDEVLSITNKIDNSFNDITDSFNNMSNMIANTIKNSPNKEDQEFAAKLAIGTWAIGQAIHGLGIVANKILMWNKANDMLPLKKEIATIKLPSLKQTEARVERLLDNTRRIFLAYAEINFSSQKIKQISTETNFFKQICQPRMLALNMFRKASFNYLTLRYLIAEYEAWIEGKHDSETVMPIMEDVNKIIFYDTLLPPDKGKKSKLRSIEQILWQSTSEINGRALYIALDKQLMAYYLSEGPLYITQERTTMNSWLHSIINENEAIVTSDEMLSILIETERMKAFRKRILTAIGIAFCYIIIYVLGVYVNLSITWKVIVGVIGLLLIYWRWNSASKKINERFELRFKKIRLYTSNRLRRMAGLTSRRQKVSEVIDSSSDFFWGILGFIGGFLLLPFPGGALIGALIAISLGSSTICNEKMSDGRDYAQVNIGKVWPYYIVLTTQILIIGYMLWVDKFISLVL